MNATIAPERSVLVVEDAPEVREQLTNLMQAEGYAVDHAGCGEETLAKLREDEPDLVLLHPEHPNLADCRELLREIRGFSDVYVLLLSERGDEDSRVGGLVAGADDYITRPFSPRELTTRAQVLMRRPRRFCEDTILRFGDLEIEPGPRRVLRDGEEVALTRIEFDILATLAARHGDAVSRTDVFRAVWGAGARHDDHVLDVHVSNLRRKVEADPRHPRHVRTIRGVGFRLDS